MLFAPRAFLLLLCAAALNAQTTPPRIPMRDIDDQHWAQKTGLPIADIRAIRIAAGEPDNAAFTPRILNLDVDTLKQRNHILFVDANNTRYGSMELEPGEIVDVQVDAAGNVDATVLNGVVTITVGSDTRTLGEGESASFESPLVTLDDAFDAVIAQVQGFVASGDIRNRGIGNSLIALLRVAKALSHFHPPAAKAGVALVIKLVQQHYKTHHISLAARNALVASLQALAAQM